MAGTILMEHRATMAPTEAGLSGMHEALARFWDRGLDEAHALPGDGWRLEFLTALGEIAANVVRHARPRAAVTVELRLYPRAVEATFLDDGVEFDPAVLEANRVPPEIGDDLDLPESGYGLSMAAGLVDELAYERTPERRNRWRLLKRWS